MGKIFNQVRENIDRGMKGLNTGLPMGLPKTSKIIFDVQRGRYDLIGGKTSSGKTAFVDQCYVVEPFYYALNNPDVKLDILYFSLEISPEDKFTKIAARFLFQKYGIRLDSNKLLSRGDYRLSTEIRKTLDTLESVFDKLESIVHIYDTYRTRTEITGKIHEFLLQNGRIDTVEGRYVYTPKAPNNYLIIVIDTINLISVDKGETKKQAMDELSRELIQIRNICRASPVVIQQLNSEMTDIKRVQLKKFEPINDDVEDSKGPTKDANTILLLFDPLVHNLTNHRGYDLARLNGGFRQIQVTKNRDGLLGDRVGLYLDGGVGIFTELPRGSEMTPADYLKYG